MMEFEPTRGCIRSRNMFPALFLMIFVILNQVSPGIANRIQTNQQEVGKAVSYSISSDLEYIIEITNLTANLEVTPPRVHVSCDDCDELNPVLVVVRQNKGVMSWELPLVVDRSPSRPLSFKESAHTLCPNDLVNSTCMASNPLKNVTCNIPLWPQQNYSTLLTVSLSTSSVSNQTVILNVSLVQDFLLSLDSVVTIPVTPTTPYYFVYKFPSEKNVTSVLLRLNSTSEICMLISIQNVSCPVFDSEENIAFKGLWQTVTSKGGITITSESFPLGFYATFVVTKTDGCSSLGSISPDKRLKEITISLNKTIGYDYYFYAGAITCLVVTIFFVFTMTVSFVYLNRTGANLQSFNESVIETREASTSIVSNRNHHGIPPAVLHSPTGDTLSIKTDSSLDETDVDYLLDTESDKNIIRLNRHLFVTDLSRKTSTVLKKKSELYLWHLLTVAIFYFLPVVQLVIAYQNELNETGKQDICYYNFLCAHPLGFVSDFNHIFSNIGYLILGLLFIMLTYKKERIHANATALNSHLDKGYGIPQHFGLFYAMGTALLAEGVLSGCYHFCPNHSNFQFDTSFMYVISTLCMLKIYQTRHPDINATAYATYLVLAGVILLGMWGVLRSTFTFWCIFTFLHLAVCLYLSLKIYYVGLWRLRDLNPRRFWIELKSSWRQCSFWLPTYTARFCLIVLANVGNWTLAIFGPSYQFDNFATHLLFIFMGNLLFYTISYILMKLVCKEKILLQPAVYILLSVLCWSSSLYFFLNKTISWKETPARSKHYNQPCILWDFYDNHDVWHFLSAAAMFFSFMVLLTLDDDLTYVHRSQISVF